MLQNLSATSPYVCDLSRGPIEPANRMASRSSNKLSELLEPKKSSPKTRTPLKLLHVDEIPMDVTTAPNDINASLQPIWYSEQTIVDDHPVQQEGNSSIIHEKSRTTLARSTLPPIQSEGPAIDEEDDLPVNQPSLMHKSSTFTVESSMDMESALSDLEKENLIKDDPMPSMTAPSDESFRALEQLLGLGSGATTMRESPKPNQDTLSLTVVTPTDIVNSTRRSSRLSVARKTITDSLPSSQEIPKMPTIESITSINMPSFLADNTTMADEQASATINQQSSLNISENTSKNDDESSFSFELNDFTNSTKNESIVDTPQPVQPMPAMRAPTCADVAYRALVKRRVSGRVSQPIKAQSPLAGPNKARSSAPNARFLRSSCRRISNDSAPQSPIAQEQSATTNECFINTEAEANANHSSELIEMVSVPEEDEPEQQKTMSTTLNRVSTKPMNQSKLNVSKQIEETNQPERIATPTKPMMPMLSREYTYNTPKRRSSQRGRSMLNASAANQSQNVSVNEAEAKSPSIASRSMLNVLLTQPTEQQSVTNMDTLSPAKSATNSPSIASRSMLNILLTKPTEARKSKVATPYASAANSPSNSMLNILLSKPTQTEARPSTRRSKVLTPSKSVTNSPSVLSKSMLGILLTQPTDGEKSVLQETLSTSIKPTLERVSSGKPKRLSTNLTPRGSINPLHSSTPSTERKKSLQMVSIGEQEQVLTTVPAQEEIPIIQLNETEQSMRKSTRTIDTGVQTTPSLNYVSRRYFDSIDDDSTALYEMNKSASNAIIREKEITPLQTKIVMNLKRNVRFQLTPTTDARLTEKEKIEEALRGLKPDIVIQPAPLPVPVVVKAEIKKPVKRLQKARKGKKKLTSRKKTTVSNKKPAEKKPQEAKHVSPKKAEVVATKKVLQRKRASAEPIVEPVAAKRSKPAEVRVTSSKARTASASNKKTKVESNKRQRSTSKTTEKKKPEPKKQKPAVVKVEQPKRNASKTKKAEPKVEKPTPAPVKKVEPKPAATKATKKNARKEKAAAVANSKPEPTKPTRSASAANKNTTVQPVEEKRSVSVANEKKAAEPKRKSLKNNKKVEQPQPTATTETKVEPVEKKRSGSIKNKKVTPEPSNERQSRAQTRSAKNTIDVVAQPVEPKPTKSKKAEVKHVEKKKEAEKEKPVVKNVESNDEQRKKMEELTVAELKSRLNKHKQDIPKGAKKADLIALLMKQETPVVEKKPVEAPVAKTTRRHKK